MAEVGSDEWKSDQDDRRWASNPQPRQYEDLANSVSSLGRGPDTTMIHVAPLELEVLDRMTPGGLSTNPHTGKKEAVWWFAPLVGALLGGTMGGITAKKRDIPLWKGILMGAGTGALSGAVTGGLGALASPTTQVVVEGGKEALVQAAVEGGKEALMQTGINAGGTMGTGLGVMAPQAGVTAAEAAVSHAPMLAAAGPTAGTFPQLAGGTLVPGVTSGPVSSSTSFLASGGADLGGETLMRGAAGGYNPSAATGAGAPELTASPLSQIDPSIASPSGGYMTQAPAEVGASFGGQMGQFGEQLGQGLGEYVSNPMHAIAALGATEQVLPKYKADNPWGDAFAANDYDPYWEDEVSEYDHSSGPYWS